MSVDPNWASDGTQPPEHPVPPESALERTDPLLPVITRGMPPPIELARVPTLDDRTLAEMLADLDGEAEAPASATGRDAPAGADVPPDRPAESPAPAATPVETATPVQTGAQGTYVRRDYQPPPRPVEALSLTGLTRRSRGRIGSRLFTVAFVAIFVLILVQAVVSLLSAVGR